MVRELKDRVLSLRKQGFHSLWDYVLIVGKWISKLRKRGFLSGSCGSCWAFSVVASVESVSAIEGQPLVSLSEQELIDCDPNSMGCKGGVRQYAMKFVASFPWNTALFSKPQFCLYCVLQNYASFIKHSLFQYVPLIKQGQWACHETLLEEIATCPR